ncbi:MAG: transglycosylase SLT domain-containing protein [Thiogranum sp.]|nr:transglycosylase SLT domain-containing protein [Thiogranum sp.]
MPTLNARLAALMVLFAAPVKGADELVLERPAALQPAITFWTRVYSEVDSLAGYVHDNRNLEVVYETLKFNWYDSAQVQERQIAQAVQRHREALQALSGGKRKDLTAHEQKVLALWGDKASAANLKAAADRLRFQRGQADRIREGVIRSGAWEKRIRKALQDAGLPQELAALPYVESSYDPNVQSHAGAVGLWQFTHFTGSHYLRVDNVVDERVDPVKSTDGAVRLLQRYYSRLRSWPLTITAYNHGLSGVRRAVQETGSRDIGDIVRRYKGPRFGFASRNYYAAFLAVSDVTRNAEKYFGPLDRQQGEDYWIVKSPRYLPVNDLLQQLALDADAVKALNPALQPAVWSGSKYVPKGYPLRLPATTGSRTITALLTRVPGYAKQMPDVIYRVKEGDTLSGIALRHNHSVRELMALNDLRSENRILAGQSLRLLGSAVSAKAAESSGDNEGLTLQPASDVSYGSIASVP